MQCATAGAAIAWRRKRRAHAHASGKGVLPEIGIDYGFLGRVKEHLLSILSQNHPKRTKEVFFCKKKTSSYFFKRKGEKHKVKKMKK